MRDYLRSADRFPPALDALFDFIRSQAPTNPQLRKEIQNPGQIALDLFARSGHTGRVSRPILRVRSRSITWLATRPESALWAKSAKGRVTRGYWRRSAPARV